MLRKVVLAVGEIYHIYTRGTDKRVIFLDVNDFRRFVILLYVCNTTKSINMSTLWRKDKTSSYEILDSIEIKEKLVDIGAWCLMDNHIHILVRERIEGGTSLFMKKLLTAYSMYFNKKYERSGSLFESRFKSQHVDDESYLNWLFSYIHLNPAKIIDPNWKNNNTNNQDKIYDFIKNYQFSSYVDYSICERSLSVILNKKEFPAYWLETDDIKSLFRMFKDRP